MIIVRAIVFVFLLLLLFVIKLYSWLVKGAAGLEKVLWSAHHYLESIYNKL